MNMFSTKDANAKLNKPSLLDDRKTDAFRAILLSKNPRRFSLPAELIFSVAFSVAVKHSRVMRIYLLSNSCPYLLRLLLQ